MGGAAVTWRAATRALIRAGGVAVFILLSCGEPLGSVPYGWEVRAEIPSVYQDFSPLAVGPRGVYGLAVPQEGLSQLVVFDGSEFRVDYTTSGEGEYITGVAFFGDSGFMGVTRPIQPEGREAVLLRSGGGGWEEVLVTREYLCFSKIRAAGGDTVWMIGEPDSGTPVIVKYENGSLKYFGVAKGRLTTYSPKTNRYAVCNGGDGTVWITEDGGTTWYDEVMELPAHYKLFGVVDMAASTEALYFAAKVLAADFKYYAIIKRTGAPGEGVYEFSYVGWAGPGVGRVDLCAFRGANRGLAVGLGTTMYYDAPDWFRETVDPLQNFRCLQADPSGGYWAVSERSLLWHP